MSLEDGRSAATECPYASLGESVIGIIVKFAASSEQGVATDASGFAHAANAMASEHLGLARQELAALAFVVCGQTLHFLIA